MIHQSRKWSWVESPDLQRLSLFLSTRSNDELHIIAYPVLFMYSSSSAIPRKPSTIEIVSFLKFGLLHKL